MQINAPFNPVSARRARDLLGVTNVLSVVPQVTLKELGFIGDGNSHPLSERFGSLPAAQAVYPRAASLSEEIDGHAIQLCIDQQHAAWKPVVVHLPPGCYGQLSFPIRSGKLPTLLVGENSTLTQRTAGANGWEHGTDATGFKALYGASFQAQVVKMCCLGKGGTAFFVQQDPTSGGFVMRDVNIVGSGDSSVNYWDRAVVGIGTSYTTFANVSALGQLGGNLRDKLDAFYFTFDTAQFPTTQGAFIFRFVDCDISWFGRGYNFDIPRTMEGIWIVRGNVNSCRHAVRLFNTTINSGGVASPQFVFDGALMECWSTFFELQSVKFITVVNCLFLINGPKPEYAADDYLWDWMKVGVNCTDIIVAHNHFEFFDKSHPRWLFNAEDLGIENVSIHHNTFRWNGTSAPSQIAQFGHAGYGRKGIREFSNVGLTGYVWSQVAGTANRENANFSESAIISALMSTGDELVSLNFVTGVATVAGWRAAAPQAVGAARIAYLDVPAGVLSKNPTLVTPCFADDAGVSAGETLAVSAGLTTKTRFAINVVGYNGSGARRIGFTAIG